MVYKVPSSEGQKLIPVGVVSKNYKLVDHDQVLRAIARALSEQDFDLKAFCFRAQWTIHGERAIFSIIFPPERRFSIQVTGEQDEIRFRIEVFNSVEGSYRLIAVAGWLRFVCCNGLILGTAILHLHRQHRQQLQIDELSRLVRESIDSAENDKVTFETWLRELIKPADMGEWVDEDVCSKWGVKAAVRVLSIATHGRDADLRGEIRNRRPSQIETKRLREVPGVTGPAKNAFKSSTFLGGRSTIRNRRGSRVAGSSTRIDEQAHL